MVIKIEALEQLLTMDFSQLRALNGRATDEAMLFFIEKLTTFFEQNPTQPNQYNRKIYNEIMEKIIDKINISEKAYYEKTNPDIDSDFYKIDLKSLPKRMQWWAASQVFADPIRNIKKHKFAAGSIEKWLSTDSMENDIREKENFYQNKASQVSTKSFYAKDERVKKTKMPFETNTNENVLKPEKKRKYQPDHFENGSNKKIKCSLFTIEPQESASIPENLSNNNFSSVKN